MEQGTILAHTKTIAAQLAKQFDGNPKGELDCWIATAQQREAMVVQIYDAMNLESRIPEQQGDEAKTVKVVRGVIGAIWAQESSHSTLMSSLRKLNDPGAQLAGINGTVEGLMTAWATSGGVLGPIALAAVGIARVFKAAPAFTAQLGTLSLGDFFRFSEELEHTASNGYKKILELLAQLEDAGQDSGYGPLSQYEFATTLAEENFHRAIFQRMDAWLKKGDRELDAIPRDSTRNAIEQLMHQHLGMRNVAGLPKSRMTRGFTEAEGDSLISDAGFGSLLAELDLSPRVAPRPEA